jgi:hypothetical protein
MELGQSVVCESHDFIFIPPNKQSNIIDPRKVFFPGCSDAIVDPMNQVLKQQLR